MCDIADLPFCIPQAQGIYILLYKEVPAQKKWPKQPEGRLRHRAVSGDKPGGGAMPFFLFVTANCMPRVLGVDTLQCIAVDRGGKKLVS